MNTIKATIGGTPAIVLSRTTAFASKHAAQATTLELTKDGKPYIGAGRSEWEWTVDQNGARVNDRGSNFRLRPPQLMGSDAALFSVCDPNRGFPDEAIEPATAVRVGDKVVVESRAKGAKFPATVTSIDTGAFLIHTTFAGVSGDSGSIVTTEDGRFVGFQSSTTGVSVPNLAPLSGTTPAPKPPQPTPVPAPDPTLPANTTPVQAWHLGVKEGRAKLAADLKALLESA